MTDKTYVTAEEKMQNWTGHAKAGGMAKASIEVESNIEVERKV
jgi:hypothetical protein